jgi:hypothetical protein
MFKIFGLFLTLSLSLIIVSCGTSEAEKQAGTTSTHKYVTMPDSTAIAVTLVDSIDTDFQLSGSEFRARLNEPVVVNGYTLFTDGSEAKGILSRVVESGRLKTPAELDYSLTSIKDGSGHWINVGTDMILQKKASHTNRQVAMIGGGAIVGGIIGKIIDQKNSTEIGAATGAVAGAGLATATGKQDIFMGVGTEVTFFSSHSMQIALK